MDSKEKSTFLIWFLSLLQESMEQEDQTWQSCRLLTFVRKEGSHVSCRAIELFNSERKELDQKITAQALDQIKDNQEEELYSTVVFQPDWHKGVLGIVLPD